MIKNMRNGKKYIGSTKNASGRWKNHLKALKKGNHHCNHLQNAWNAERDKRVFKFFVFIYCSETQLIPMEQSCFDHMKPEYNENSVAGRPPSFSEWSSEKQEAHRKRAIERFSSDQNPVFTIDPDILSKILSKSARKSLERGNHWTQTLSAEELSDRARRGVYTQLEKGNHSSQTMSDADKKAVGRRRGDTLIQNGNGKRAAKKMVDEGRHPFQLRSPEERTLCAKKGFETQIKNGTHNSQTMTAEQKTISANRTWATRRWNKLKKLLDETPIWCS
jgi:group I intron endonuclease